MLVIVGIPLVLLELAVGQKFRKGPIGSWSLASPYLAGVGVASLVTSILVAFYYNTLLAWCISYLVNSFYSPLPWSSCTAAVNRIGEIDPEVFDEFMLECNRSSATEFFWYRNSLKVSSRISQPGNYNWEMNIYLLIAWGLVWAILAGGIKFSGKVVYFTATFPYIVLLSFLIRGVTLEGMENGYKYLFNPDWNRLSDVTIWMTAATQIFFTLGVGCGVLISYSSYMPNKNNCLRDGIIVSIINCCTSVFAATVIFAILGFKGTKKYEECLELRHSKVVFAIQDRQVNNLSNIEIVDAGPISSYILNGSLYNISGPMINPELDCNLNEFVKSSASGTGFVFIIFTEAINEFPGAQFWALLFFIMLINVGLDSSFGTVEGGIAGIVDILPSKSKRWIVTSCLCGAFSIFSVIFAFGWGSYILRFMDEFTANWPLLLICLFECLGISWVYGSDKFGSDIEAMTGEKVSQWLLLSWKYVSPFAILVMIVVTFYQYITSGLTYEVWDSETSLPITQKWPTYILVTGFTLTFISTCSIPLVAIWRFYCTKRRKRLTASENAISGDESGSSGSSTDPQPNC